VATRTTPDAVRAVLQRDYDAKGRPSLNRQVQTASAVVSRVDACAKAKNVTLTAEELELIECWLAAHFYAVSDKPYASKNTLNASGSFHGRTDMSLDATLYGQQAQVVDYSGCLTAISKHAEANAFWAGKEPKDWKDTGQTGFF
jgi:hypothetical protein